MSFNFTKKCSKIVSGLLTASMVLSAFPVMAFASELREEPKL